jgi:hypothetical protein
MVLRRTRRGRNPAGYVRAHREILLCGRWYFSDSAHGFYRRNGAMDLEEVKGAWEELRGELLPAYIADHPGTRPWAWWRFDAPEPYRRFLGGYDFRTDPAARVGLTAEIHTGLGWYSSIGEAELTDPPIVETQAGYLERHGLLTDAEREVLGPEFPREEAMCERELTR